MEHLSLYTTYIPKMWAELGQKSDIRYTHMGRVQVEVGAGRKEKKVPGLGVTLYNVTS